MTTSEYQPDYPFISQSVLERLINGDFKPIRSKKSRLTVPERRDRISPLGVIKRAIRYEPNIFSNRRQLVFDIATRLNSPEFKIVALYGPDGIGKTALARAIVEMMGGTPAQLLWFDGSPLTDIEQMSRFCVEYLLYISRSMRLDMQFKEALNPRDTLRILLSQIPDIPILLVIDNIELYVSDDLTWRAPELKEMLQYLLEFENIKILLLGKKLPEADLESLNHHLSIRIPPLPENAMQELLIQNFPECQQPINIPFFRGNPEWLWTWVQLQQYQQGLQLPTANETAAEFLTQLFLNQCSEAEKITACLLAIIRHGVNQAVYDAFVNALEPIINDNEIKLITAQEFPSSILRWISKKAFSPQAVLGYVRQRLGVTEDKISESKSVENKAIEPYYTIISDIGHHLIINTSVNLLSQLHQSLAQFYDTEQQRPIHQRIFPMKTRFLTNEAEYHRKMAKLVFSTPRPSKKIPSPTIKVMDEKPAIPLTTLTSPGDTTINIQKQKLHEQVSHYQTNTNENPSTEIEATLEHYYLDGINAHNAGKLDESKKQFQHWLTIEAIVRKTNPEKLFNVFTLLSAISLNFNDYERSFYYLKKAESIQNRTQNTGFKINYYFTASHYWHTQQNVLKSLQFLTKAIRLARKENDNNTLARAYKHYGELLITSSHGYWGSKTLVFAAEQYEKKQDFEKAIQLWLYLAKLQQQDGDRDMALLNLQQAQRIAQRSQNLNYIQMCKTILQQFLVQSE